LGRFNKPIALPLVCSFKQSVRSFKQSVRKLEFQVNVNSLFKSKSVKDVSRETLRYMNI